MNEHHAIPSPPPHVPAHLVIDFDICTDAALEHDAFARLEQLRSDAPAVAWSPHSGGHWLVFGEDEIQSVLTSPEDFTTDYLNVEATLHGGPPVIPLGLEPPEHGPWRSLLVKHLRPAKIKQLEESARARAEDLIGKVAAKDRCEFLSEVAEPMPITIFMELMGLPLESFAVFRGLVLQLLDPAAFRDPAQYEARIAATIEIKRMLAELIEDRQSNPRDDLISTLVSEKVQGRTIQPDELLSMCFILVIGGLDTVTNAITFGIRHLAQDAELQESLRRDPRRIKDAMEWLLRRFTFVNVQRAVKRDNVFRGVEMKQGEMVWNVLWSGSNLPDKDRHGPRHLAFGYGHHVCVGMHLARLELRVMYETWFKKIGKFRLAADDLPRMGGGPIMHMKHLVLDVTPA